MCFFRVLGSCTRFGIRGARQKYGSNSTYFRGTPLFVAYYRDQISRIYASSTAALVQNLAVFALEKIGKSSRSLSIVILKNSKKVSEKKSLSLKMNASIEPPCTAPLRFSNINPPIHWSIPLAVYRCGIYHRDPEEGSTALQ